jgi:hypothetical protein
VTVIHSPSAAQSPPAPDIVQDFNATAIRLLERFAQDASDSARKRESWARIAHVADETEPDKAAALAHAIVSAAGVEHTDKLGECQRAILLLSYFLLYLVCAYARHAGEWSPQARREKKRRLFGYIVWHQK